GGRTPEHRADGKRGGLFSVLSRQGELPGGAKCFLHRNVSPAHRHDPAATAGQPVMVATRYSRACSVLAGPRLHYWRVRQEPPGRQPPGPADGTRLHGILGLPLPPRCDAGGELPRNQTNPHPPSRRPPRAKNTSPVPAPRP